ncbi:MULTISPECIES: response regulator transcription factor [Sphingobacterium]|jgi:DNA-binding response OmpR family regulator|uniref:DNA-binding response OmpR family regulator n=1 Tax=Sphingobacterium siyangense TaxID=459529 RepID=A0A562MAH4_9SPHI|nr:MULTISPECIES: response regulator transcription factor [Sphingobacterium]MBB1642498.1 DNA-binding response regulator [Sphingobacterium sp. UME9]TWI16903.1 DNA-binding response OmpR family regulator [Sphingobacterium siyangense]
MQILLVEDDRRISSFVVKGLEEMGHQVILVESAEAAREWINADSLDIIVLDIMLPGIDGIQFTKMVRYRKNHIPILILSALGEIEDKVEALESGADDYLVKPFSFKELVSRIKALVRRDNYKNVPKDSSVEIRDLKVDLERYEVHKNGKNVDLSPKEFKLFKYLIENRNKTLSRTAILQAVWGIDFDNSTNVVDVYVSYLRGKVDEGSDTSIIKTVKGVGYMLTTD